jgi:hypothetical protein
VAKEIKMNSTIYRIAKDGKPCLALPFNGYTDKEDAMSAFADWACRWLNDLEDDVHADELIELLCSDQDVTEFVYDGHTYSIIEVQSEFIPDSENADRISETWRGER